MASSPLPMVSWPVRFWSGYAPPSNTASKATSVGTVWLSPSLPVIPPFITVEPRTEVSTPSLSRYTVIWMSVMDASRAWIIWSAAAFASS